MSSRRSIESLLCKVASQILKKDESQVDLGKSLAEQGGDALSAVFFAGQCRDLDLLVDVGDVSQGMTINDLVSKLVQNDPQLQSSEEPEQQPARVPSTLLQNLYNATGLRQALIWNVEPPMTHDGAVQVIKSLTTRHMLLSASLEVDSETPHLLLGTTDSPSGTLVPYESDEKCAALVKELQMEPLSSQSTTPVLSALFFGETSQIKKIGLVALTGAIDAHSWHILLRDIHMYSCGDRKVDVQQPHTFIEWIEKAAYQREAEAHNIDIPEVQLRSSESPSLSLHEPGAISSYSFDLSLESTESLQDEKCHQIMRTEMADLILGALAASFSDQFPSLNRYLEVRDGRPRQVDGSWDAVIGCFDELTEIPFHCSRDVLDASRKAKDGRRRSVLQTFPDDSNPNNLIFDTSKLKKRRVPEDTSQLADDVSKHDIGKLLAQTIGGIYVSPFWTSNKLSFLVVCSADLGSEAELKASAESIVRHIDDVVLRLAESSPLPTLSDFPYISMDYPSLDRVFEQKLLNIARNPLKDIDNIYPCSPVQENILVANSVDKGAYICAFTVRVATSGQFASCDADRWVAAWSRVVEKHSSLRTVFIESAGRQGHYDQVVLNKVTPRVNVITSTTAAPEIEFQPLEVPHHLTVGQAGSGQFTLVLTISHALTDGHSAEVILSDMCRYIAGCDDNSERVLSYSDYVVDQHLPLGTTVSDYWRKYIQKTQETHLPVTREASDLRGFDTVKSAVAINVKSIDRLCQQHNISLANVCQAAWGVVLRGHLGVDNVCFSYISSVRHVPLKGIMTAVGPLITTLLCSMNLEGEKNVMEAIKDVNSDYMESLSHESELSDAVSTRRWSNTVMSFRRRLVQDDESLPGLSCKIVKGSSPTNYDVSLIVSAGQADMEVSLDYWASRMDREYAQSLLQNFQEVLYSIFRDVSATVAELELVSNEQEQRILEQNAHVPETSNRCVHDLVNSRISKQATAVAVEAWDGSLTYGELDHLASHLAQHLTAMGAGPEIPIGICMDKSKLVPVTMLGILRSGSAVVPIGTGEPTARVEAILADSSPLAIICDEKQVERLSGLSKSLLNVSEIISTVPSSAPRAPTQKEQPQPKHIAWVFYTSGSTGTPKGVLIEHSALATSMLAHGAALGVSRETRVLQFSAHTFDVSLQELITTLIYGGCVCIPNEQDRVNDLAGSVRRLQVNMLALTSSVASTIKPEDVPLVQKLVLFGEEVKTSVLECWLGKASVFNAYGPTESSIFASVSKPFRSVEDAPNIGFPMSVNFWVTDPENPGRLCPPGAPGELLIEGPLLARGYLNDEAKTAAAFIRDPAFSTRLLGAASGRRFYRTGDIVRQNVDLSMSYVGRIGTQIKIRGQRLDVAEVEHWIIKLLDGVSRAVVGLLKVLGEDGNSSKGGSLFAAIEFPDNTSFVPSDNGDILPASDQLRDVLNQLRNTLQIKLPAYMIPTFYIPFRRIPLTASSKTDRKMIGQLISELSTTDLQSYVSEDDADDESELQTETIRALKSLWAEVLGESSTSIKMSDHFLYRGGDSVSAIRLVEAARLKHINLTVSDVLSVPRLEDLARLVDERAGAAKTIRAQGEEYYDPHAFSLWESSPDDRDADLADIASQCGLKKTDIEDVYPCTPLQEGMLAATQQRPTAYLVRRVYALSEPIDLKRFRKAWQVMIETAPLMRTRIVLGQRSGSLQVVSKTGPVWQYRDSLEEYISEDQNQVMSPGEPLMRFALIQDAPSGLRYFVWTAHHSVYDGWSAQLIYKRLVNLYLHDERPPTVPFTRFISHLQGGDLRGEEATVFWRNQLEGDVPAAFPSMPSSYYQPKPLAVLQSEVETSLSASSRSELSLANVLRAAWAMTLSQYVGTSDIVFGATVSGRNAPVAEITELIAPTITTVPVVVHIDRDAKVGEYLAGIQSQALEMIPFEHTGLEDIRRLVPDLHHATDIKHVFLIEPSPIGEAKEVSQIAGMSLVDTALDAFDTFALTIQCQLPSDVGGSVKIEARFDEYVLGEPQVAVLLRQFQHWVSQLIDESNRGERLSSLNGVTTSDLAQLKRNNAQIPVREQVCLHHLVESVARQQPTSPAICAWDGDFTYEELWGHTRTLASYLSSLGVCPGVRVAVCMDKSKWTAVAMLGILESGGVVVLLGRQDPVPRLQTMLKDCEARVLLTNEGHTKSLAGSGPFIVALDDKLMESLPTPREDEIICPSLTPYHPAWIVYTSGSTGAPKGSLLIHGGLATSLPAHGRASNWSKDSRTLQFSAHTFDVTLQELMTTLIFGGCVCIPSEEQRLNALTQSIRDLNANQLVMTFTVASTIDPSDVPSVKQLAVVGEQAKPSVVERWLGRTELINMYGPSECSVYSSCSGPMKSVEDAPNIGFPLDTCNFWIASPTDHNQLCPIGVPGELLIENAWQAQEYLNNPELTARVFVIEPNFIKQIGLGGTGRRLYRTGDLIRQNTDGSYTHLGRIDSQVKFKGHRVDLSVIEYWIRKLLSGVRTIVVDLVDLQAGKGTGDLVVVMDFAEGYDLHESEEGKEEEEEVETEDINGVTVLAPSVKLQKVLCNLKDALADKLPSYMVPTAYLPWKKIPLSPSGKTNRNAVRHFLTSLDSGSSIMQRYLAMHGVNAKESPQTEMGKQLRQLWADVLSIEADSIGAQDHFTRLGGDSLAAMKLVAAGRQAGLRLTVASIFTHPILNDFARALEKEQQEDTDTSPEKDPVPFEFMSGTELDTATSTDFQSRVAGIAAQCQVTPQQIEDVYPCTPMQEALFAMTARQPTTYTYRQVFRASQDVDMARFQDAWETVTRTLPILRTRIVLDPNAGFLQAVVDSPLAWYKGSDLDRYLETDKATGFELGRPLLRCALIQDQSSDAHYFVLTTHHSMFDRWSLQRVYQHYLYPAYAGRVVPRVVPYPRFIRYILNTDMKAASQYWNQLLAGSETFTDFPSLPSMSAEYYQPKPTSLLKQTVRVNELAELQVPFPSLLRAAWGLTVAQFAAAEDVMFAVNLSGRSAPVAEITEMAAPTFTTVPVRVKVDGAQTVQDFLQIVHRASVDMIPHEHIGLQKIKELVPTFAPADLRHLFLVHPAAEADLTAPSLRVPGFEQVHMGLEAQGDYPLAVMCRVDEGRSEAVVEARFDSAVIHEDHLEAVLRQFEHNVAQLGDATAKGQTGQTIGSLPLTNPRDLIQISRWNPEVEEPFLDLGCVHDLVRNSVRERPDAPAICSWDGQLTYEELDQMAGILAQELVNEGSVGPEVTVGLCMDKSRWAIVAMLAILYAGGAVVPLGVQLPLERLRAIVEDCAPAIILCDESHLSKLESLGLGCKNIVVSNSTLSNMARAQVGQHHDLPSSLVRPESMAWLMYTSGSTGTPKGVVLEHRNLRSGLLGKGNVCRAGPTLRTFQFSAYTFDVSISDIFVTLGCGGTVCVPSESERMNDLVGTIRRLDVNFVNITASTAALIPPSEVPAVQMLVLGGENINPALVERWLRDSNATLVNSYGPAECSIASTANAQLNNKDESAVIGKALPGTKTRTWVVDPQDHNRLAPIGAVGELLIEGPNLGRGYLNDPLKTSTSFIKDPSFVGQLGPSSKPSVRRMYRTGDLVRYHSDGSLSMLGRGDSQIKIRGQRVDLAEIESCILRLVPNARGVVVEYLRQQGDQRALVAAIEFVNPGCSDLPSISEWLKTSLAQKLPSYMVPRVYMQMDVIPKTASGKTDRRTVRHSMVGEGSRPMDQFLPDISKPKQAGKVHGDREALVRRLWAAVLGIKMDSIDREDNFFDLGADSITAMKLVAASKPEDLNVKVLDVFKNPVLWKLAAATQAVSGSVQVTQSGPKQQYYPFKLLDNVDDIDAFLDDAVCPVTGTGRESILDAFPATDAVAFNVVGALMSPQVEVNTFVLDTISDLDLDRLQKSCILLAQHVEAFRTVFVPNLRNGKLLQIILESYQQDVQLIKIDDSVESATERLLEGEMSRRFEYGHPLINMAILHQEETKKTRVLFRMSHAIYDGLSLPIIWNTLRKLYDNQDRPEKRLSSFSAYVHDLTAHTSDMTYNYWKKLLNGSAMPELSSAIKPESQTPLPMAFTGARDIAVSRLRGGGITTSAVINCAWAHVLAQYTGRDDVVFGDTISGRNLADPSMSDTLVGCCATHVPMRVKLGTSGQQTLLDLLHQVRDQQRDRIPHEGLGFRKIIRYCTDWAPSTRFTSIVNHRPGKSSAKPGGAGLDFSVSTVTTESRPLTTWYDLAIVSEEVDGVVKINLGYSTIAFQPETAQALLEDLAATVHFIMDVGASRLDQSALYGTKAMPKSSSALGNLPPTIDSENFISEGKLMSNGTAKGELVDAGSATLDRIWFSVFASKQSKQPAPLVDDMQTRKGHHMPFYQLGSDLLDAAYLVSLVEHHRKSAKRYSNGNGAKASDSRVTIDHILLYPTFVEFAGFLHHRQIELD